MKKSLTIILVAIMSLGLSAAPKAKTEAAPVAPRATKNYVVGFYNLENLFDTYNDPAKNDEEYLPEGANKWTETRYQIKLKNMAKVIAAMAEQNGTWHTILGVSEVENRLVLEDLVDQESIRAAGYQIVHYDGPDRRGVDPALLYNPRTFKYLDSEPIPFTFEDSEVEFSLDSAAKAYFRTRDILMVHGLIAGEHVAVYVAHLPSRIGGKGQDLRSRGGEIMYKHAKQMEQKYPGIKIICMGDMNDNPTDDSMSLWLRGKEKIEEVGPEDFFCPYISMLKAGYGSLAYQGEWNIYDLELVNYNLAHAEPGTLQIQTIGKKGFYGVVFHQPFMTQQSGPYKGTPSRTFSSGNFNPNGFSDHYPTYIVIGK